MASYLDYINGFWNLRRSGAFSSSDWDVYSCLLDTANRLHWKNPFTQTNAFICGLLGMSEKTLIASRNRLKQAGLIDFTTGKKRSPTTYTLKIPCKIYPSFSSENGSVSSSENGSENGSQSLDKEKDPIPLPPSPPPARRVGDVSVEKLRERLLRMFGREPTSHLSQIEMQLLSGIHVSPDDFRLLERFMALPPNANDRKLSTRKQKLKTLLEDFYGEIDRARGFFAAKDSEKQW